MITEGPLQFQRGDDEISRERKKLKVLVSIFGRPTPVEVEFEKVKTHNHGKKTAAYIRLQVPAGQANPSLPIGPAGQHQVNIAGVRKLSTQTQGQDTIIPVVITVYKDRSFTFITKTPPVR